MDSFHCASNSHSFVYIIYSGTPKCGHFWDQAKVSSIQGCPHFRGSSKCGHLGGIGSSVQYIGVSVLQGCNGC